MFKRVAIAAVALLLPFLAAAQVVAPSARSSYPLVEELLSATYLSPSAETPEPAIPVWASSDGRLLALVSMNRSEGAPVMPRAPLMGSGADWQVIDATNLLSSGLRWQVAKGFSAEASLSQARQSLGCGIAGSICSGFAGDVEQQLAASLGMSWSGNSASRYSYGVSWLRSDSDARASAALLNGVEGVGLSGGMPFTTSSASSVFARGQFVMGSDTHVDLIAKHGAAQLFPSPLSGWAGGILSTQQTSLSFGLGQGAFRGSVVGRVIDSVGSMLPGRRWTLLDFGLSWRTPWQGELSLGTQSYLTPQTEIPKREADVVPSRVPYVQYRQDL